MRKKILIIDDDDTFVQMLMNEFPGADEEILHARDGQEGLEKSQKECPDVIVLDVIMPRMLGLSVLEQLRNTESTKFIPVIVMSNFGSDENEKRAKELGATDFVAKTEGSTKHLAEIIRRHFPPSPSTD